MKPEGFMTSDMLTNAAKDTDDLVEAIQNSQGNSGYERRSTQADQKPTVVPLQCYMLNEQLLSSQLSEMPLRRGLSPPNLQTDHFLS